jgi:enoyl-CoA hydratase/carnithine racemase
MYMDTLFVRPLCLLHSWNEDNVAGVSADERVATMPAGFGAISRRNGETTPRASKPLIAAVNGGAYGGGVELLLACDLVVAGENARFGLPEVKRGVVAAQGGQ